MQSSTSTHSDARPDDAPTWGWKGGRWLDRPFAASWRRGGVALLLLCLVVYVPGQASLPPMDRDESRFAQASRQMAESGTLEGWTVPRIQDRPRLNKPPLIYWLQAGCVRLLGDQGRTHEGIWVYRLPSLLAAVATVLLTWRLGMRMFDPRPAWLAAAMLAVSPVFAWEAHQARADQVLVLTVVGAQWALWRVWRGRGRERPRQGGHGEEEGKARSPHPASPKGRGGRSAAVAGAAVPVLFWLAIAAGVLVKGPVTPMVAALTAAGLCISTRRVRWLLGLRPVLGLVILVVAIAPWAYSVGESVGWREYLGTVYDETVGRAAGAKEGHWAPPGYHLVLLPVLFWPGSLLTAAAVVAAVRVARRSAAGPPTSSSSPYLFLLAWLLPSWIVFELVSTKLPHYTMPLYPAIALLSGRAVYEFASQNAPRTAGFKLGFALWTAIGLVLVVGLHIRFVAAFVGTPAGPAPLALTAAWFAVGSLAATALAVAVRTKLIVRTHFSAVLAGAIALAWACGVALPKHRGFWLSPALAADLRHLDPDSVRPIGLADYHEDSMLFLTRGRAERVNDEGGGIAAARRWLGEHPDGLVVVGRDRDRSDWPGLRIVGGAVGAVYSKSLRQRFFVIVERADRPRDARVPR